MATTVGLVEGKNLRLWEGGTPTAVGSATNCTLSISVSTKSARHKDSTGSAVTKIGDEVSGTLTTEAYIDHSDTSHKTLGDAVLALTEVSFEFSTGNANDYSWTGTGVITSYEENAPVDGYATYSVTIETTGAITRTAQSV